MTHDGEVIYQLRLPGGKHYVGRTTRAPWIRYEEHCVQPGPWVRRHGTPEALFVVERVTHLAGAHEDAVVAQLMWVLGVNSVRGGSKLRPQDYTRADLNDLATFIGNHLNMPFKVVEARLRESDKLPINAPCLGCGGATLQGRPRCVPCFKSDATCNGCGMRGHLLRDCNAPQRAAACKLCREAAEPDDALCRACFLACSTCYDCGLQGHMQGDDACPDAKKPASPPAAGNSDAQLEESAVGGGSQSAAATTPARRKRFREQRPRFTTPGVCFTCGKRGHMAGDCSELCDVRGLSIADWDAAEEVT